ncbi:MAG: multinuclear nonheme iron-dependent oxidase, partial [Solirubrobacteraceae bacterium]
MTQHLGLGVGWRPEIEGMAARAELGFVEAIAESVDPRRPPAGLLAAAQRGLAIVPHGIRLSLGGAE